MLYKHFNIAIKAANDENYTIKFVYSTNDEDRHGEIVDQKSWILDEYIKNPVVLFAHDHNQPAIGKTVNIYFNEEGNLEGEIQFAVNEYEFAKTIYQLYKGGYMRAVSVGFQNEVVEYDEGENKVTLKRNHLFEVSCVSVPANALALAKSKGINTDSLEKHLNVEIAEKEGKVLSAKNRTAVENAISALSQVLEADTKAIEPPSNDTAVQSVKVETPKSTGVTQKNPAKIINQVVRNLLAQKRNLN